jgi:hypothetical protein
MRIPVSPKIFFNGGFLAVGVVDGRRRQQARSRCASKRPATRENNASRD